MASSDFGCMLSVGAIRFEDMFCAMYNLRVIVAVVVLHQLNIQTCTAQIVHKLYYNVSMML